MLLYAKPHPPQAVPFPNGAPENRVVFGVAHRRGKAYCDLSLCHHSVVFRSVIARQASSTASGPPSPTGEGFLVPSLYGIP